MKRISLLMALGALTLAFGCDNGNGEPDGGGIHLVDSGSGHDSGSTTTHDSGSTDTCPPLTEDPPAGNVCAQSTFTCVMGATTQAAFQACVDADPNADACVGCLNQQVISCGSMHGCDNEWGEVGCCLNTACPTGDATCVNSALNTGGACDATLSTFLSCVQGLPSGTCGITDLCFMTTTATDGGTGTTDGGVDGGTGGGA